MERTGSASWLLPPPEMNLPTRFGRKGNRIDEEKVHKDHLRLPVEEPPTVAAQALASEEDSGQHEVEENIREGPSRIPDTHEICLDLCPESHKSLTALSMDPKGSRMVTGGTDGVVRFWDLNGINAMDPKPFREFTPQEGYPINCVRFSNSGGQVLVLPADARCRIHDRNGTSTPVQQTIKGDQYIRDLQHTKGHTATITDGHWHPMDPSKWITSSLDCTIRIWDINTPGTGMDMWIPCIHTLKCVDKRGICGGRGGVENQLFVNSCAYKPYDGGFIVAGCSDGSLQLFNERKRQVDSFVTGESCESLQYGEADMIARTAHTDVVTSVKVLEDGQRMLSRSLDGTMKMWDCRKLRASTPVRTWENLPCTDEHTDITISPDESMALTGTSDGRVVAFDMHSESGEPLKEYTFRTQSAVRTLWHPILQQIIVACSDGNAYFLYDRYQSIHGALLFAQHSAPKKKELEEQYMPQKVYNYDEMVQRGGQFRETRSGKLRRVRDADKRRDKNRRERMGIPDPDEQHKIKPAAPPPESTSEPAMFANKLGIEKEKYIDEDPQKALLAVDTKKGDSFVSQAYARTQPQNILDYSDVKSAGDRLLSKKRYCPKCGVKMCTCGYLTALEKEEARKKRLTAIVLLCIIDRTFKSPLKADLPLLAYLGAATGGSTVAFLVGLELSTPLIASMLQPTVLVFAYILGMLRGSEHYSKRRVLGVVMCVSAAIGAVISGEHIDDAHPIDWPVLMGGLLILLQCVFTSSIIVLQRFSYLIGSITTLLLLFSWRTGCTVFDAKCADITLGLTYSGSYSSEGTGLLVYAVIFATCFVYCAMNWCNRQTSPSVVASFMTLQPVTTAIVQYWLLGEAPSLMQVLFFPFIVLGVTFVSSSGHQARTLNAVVEKDHELQRIESLEQGNSEGITNGRRGNALE
ncbi:WD repeat-containing protein 70 [Perkinsus chesapeaki]|uniref:WD repeat-containing protein 70 n=1 Tax=Perkinsus chesapeaki TaxID=330153 RepID=A0A7J6MVT6_PERCH|nr:WD repeat-containing protein 70 [Perkinsus chesapeaki]